MRSHDEHSFPIQDTVMHVALIGIFAMMIVVTIFVPEVLGITA